MPHALRDLISQLDDQFLSIRNPKSKIRNRLTRTSHPGSATTQPVFLNQPVNLINQST
jgi:hypothetical protein